MHVYFGAASFTLYACLLLLTYMCKCPSVLEQAWYTFRTLEVLQDRVEPGSFADVQRGIIRELGAPVEALFAEFEPEARAAASLAQALLFPELNGSATAVVAILLIYACHAIALEHPFHLLISRCSHLSHWVIFF